MSEKYPNKYVVKDRIWNPIEGKWEPRIDYRYRSTESKWKSNSVDKMKSALNRVPTSDSLNGKFDTVLQKINSLREEDDYSSRTNNTESSSSNTVYKSSNTSSYRRQQGASEGVSLGKLIKKILVVVIGVIVFGNIAFSLLGSLFYRFY